MQHDRRPLVSIIAAMARNRVIGRDNRLPWHLPADLAHFKRLTLDKPIVMGRRTWESLPGLLPRRRHILVSRDPSYRANGCLVVSSPESALAAAADEPELMVVGGAALYRAMLPMAGRMYLTLVHATLEGDSFFPAWEPECWREIEREEHASDERNAYALTFLTLERIRPDTAAYRESRAIGAPTAPLPLGEGRGEGNGHGDCAFHIAGWRGRSDRSLRSA